MDLSKLQARIAEVMQAWYDGARGTAHLAFSDGGVTDLRWEILSEAIPESGSLLYASGFIRFALDVLAASENKFSGTLSVSVGPSGLCGLGKKLAGAFRRSKFAVVSYDESVCVREEILNLIQAVTKPVSSSGEVFEHIKRWQRGLGNASGRDVP